MDIETVAVYSTADENALHVRLADAAVHIGESPSRESYLRGQRVIEAALQSGANAIHPGFGFLSENPAFAEAVREASLIYIAPPTEAIRLMGSKTEARSTMQLAGVPVVPGFQGAIADFPAQAEKIGFPVMVKAAAGGGGKGMRIVWQADELPEAIAAAQSEAQNAFGDDTLFLEKYLPVAHHVEFQIFGDSHGTIVHLFERECSIQRRHQKIIEESPSPLMTNDLRQKMAEAAIGAAQAVNYENAGTVEFIVDENGNFYFLEMNTRLQVEHPVTEMVTGLDLVALQIRAAAGEPLPFTQEALLQRGHAIECRIYAEDAENGFLPSTGTVLLADFPQMPNVRIDSGVATGDTVSPYYDPMIAKLIAYGPTRQDAVQLAVSALRQTHILGVTTNMRFLLAVLQHEAFIRGDTPTDFIPQHFSEWAQPTPDEQALHMALIGAALNHFTQQPAKSAATAGDNSDAFSPWNRADGFRMGAG